MDKYKNIITVILSFISICCLSSAAVLLMRDYSQDGQMNELLESMQTSSPESPKEEYGSDVPASPEPVLPVSEPVSEPALPVSEPTPVPAVPLVPNPYRDAFLSNEDCAAWLTIPGTSIDYPVMWTPGDENYYLYRGFDGKDNKNGCLILDTDSSLDPLTTNLIIHGHNMKSGAMFGRLTDYESEAFYREHPTMTLYTEECERHYEVIAAFRSQVYKKTDTVFKFYKFFQADTQEEFDDFYQNIKALSQYDTAVTAEFGDRFLTLSTCVYHVEQGRFVVVAKETGEGDHYEPVN